jgi:hypothetical protein
LNNYDLTIEHYRTFRIQSNKYRRLEKTYNIKYNVRVTKTCTKEDKRYKADEDTILLDNASKTIASI